MTMRQAQINDLGYRAFEGQRAGVGWAMWSLGVHAARRVFGLKRQARHKVIPVIALLIAFVPALIFVGLAIIIPADVIEDALLPTYAEYFGQIGFAVLFFASIVAPDVLTGDRRSGMLALYLASPLDRTTYVIAKAASVVVVLLSMTMLPQLFLLLANTIAGTGPSFGEFFKLLVQIIGSGIMTGVFFAGLSLAIATLTPRRSFATGAILMTLLISTVAVQAIVESTDSWTGLGLLNFGSLPFAASTRLFGEDGGGGAGLNDLSDPLVILATMAFGLAGLAFTWWRYQTIEVDR
ncbi:MAG: ABC transporter permease [Acidimicrobiales bacterium]|nr:ABC transporter permease [Acidimicrobiales bacterium]